MSKNIEAGKGHEGATHVRVYSKLPNGLVLQISHQEERPEVTMNGGINLVKVWVKDKDGEQYTIPGTAVAFGQMPKHRTVAGYAVSEPIPAEFWAVWIKQHSDAHYLQRGLVFACPIHAQTDGDDQAMDGESLRTGLEPIDPNNLPKEMARGSRNLSAIQAGERR